MVRPDEENAALLNLVVNQDALFSIEFGRDDQDSFAVDIRSLQVSGDLPWTTEEISPLLPAGSKWSPALGWRSFSGVPFFFRQKRYLAIGVESIVPHPSRGAFATYKGFIFPWKSPP